MNIYKIERDGFDFQELDLEINDIIEHFPEKYEYGQCHDFSRENIALKDFWPPLRTGFSKIEGNKNLIPDITTWIDATLLLSPKSYRLVGDLLKPFGEFLPIIIENENYNLFNCLTVVDAVVENSDANRVAFDEGKVTDTEAFKTQAPHCFNIFCTERLKNAVEGFQLKGITFDKI